MAKNFTILDVVNILNLPIRNDNNNILDVDCPLCEGNKKQGKMRIWLDGNNYNCIRCGSAGNAISLYSRAKNIDSEQAIREMLDYVNNNNSYFPVIKKQHQSNKNAETRASSEEIDRTYRKFLSLCSLETSHKQNLTKRGLTEKQILHYGFKTTPVSKEQHKKIIRQLLLEGYTLEGVPGFFVDKNGNWNYNLFNFSKGILIPIMSIDRKIKGFQIRLDNPKPGKGKYIWFASANKNKGIGSKSPVHLTNPIGVNTNKTIFITEGALKADIAHSISGMTFIAIAGVNVQKTLPKYLTYLKKKLGVTRIVDCFDSDSETNINVEKAREKLMRLIIDCGLSYSKMTWDTRYKGIDDYLYGNQKGNWKFNISEINS